MKFKPGDLVEVEKGQMRFVMVEGDWVPSTKKIFGTVLGLHQDGKYSKDKKGLEPLLYDVLIDGKNDVKIEHLLSPIEEP